MADCLTAAVSKRASFLLGNIPVCFTCTGVFDRKMARIWMFLLLALPTTAR